MDKVVCGLEEDQHTIGAADPTGVVTRDSTAGCPLVVGAGSRLLGRMVGRLVDEASQPLGRLYAEALGE